MHLGEIFLLLAGSLAVTAFARWRGWSAPLLVMGAAFVVSVIPGVPDIAVDGELVLSLVLPPLLYSAALDVTYLNFRKSFRQIRRLGIWLPVVTAAGVGLVVWLIAPELGLPVALLIGAIVSPSDAVSAAAVGRRLGLPRRVMTVLSGESLINDATALTMFKMFGAIAVGATVTWTGGVVDFLVAVTVGVGLGLLIGWLVTIVRRRLDDAVVLGTLGLLVPYLAYALAERFGGSGVLAVVTAGILIGFQAPTTSYATRQQERPLWQSIDVLLEGTVFALIGLQLPRAIADAAGSPIGLERTLLLAASVLVAVVLVRVVWVFGGYGFSRVVGRRVAAWAHAHGHRYRPEPRLARRELFVIAWAGMRGVVTLATAAATPLAHDSPATGTVFLVAFTVTVGTLLAQGLSLPVLITRLGVGNTAEHEQDRRDIRRVLSRSAEAGASYVEQQHAAWRERYGPEIADPIFERFTARIRRDEQRAAEYEAVDEHAAERHEDFAELMREWIGARRRIVLEERDAGRLNEEVMRELMYALDAEELAFDRQTAVRTDSRRGR